MRAALVVVVVAGCGHGTTPGPVSPQAAHAQLSMAADDRMIAIPAGKYIAGSTPEERAAAYDAFLAATAVDTARENHWFDNEEDRHVANLPAFKIDLMPVTQAAFAEFVAAGKAAPPTIDEAAWHAQGFTQDFTNEVVRYLWTQSAPPQDRLDHPVVLITWDEANRYCAWRGELRGAERRLPTAAEFEKAARGDGGLAYPWGNAYEAAKLNNGDSGPKDTMPVGSFTTGASPYGVLDMAGNVFQWTSTPGDAGMMLVKGSAWEDHAGVGRAAARQGRKSTARHVVLGFRCAGAA